jgi:hypothetical protein
LSLPLRNPAGIYPYWIPAFAGMTKGEGMAIKYNAPNLQHPELAARNDDMVLCSSLRGAKRRSNL